MSHQAVRDFYKKLSASASMQQDYKTLCRSFFLWISPNKVVSFAKLQGYEFTVEQLKFVRLTNITSATQPAIDLVDYAATEHTESPDNPAIFRKDHGRDPG